MTDHESESIRRQAAYWAVRLEGSVTEQERQVFEAWVSSDPALEREFVAQIWLEAAMRELPLKARAPELKAVPRTAVTPSSRRTPLRLRHAALAAMVLIAVLGGIWQFGIRPESARTYATATGGMHRAIFPDGSAATLNTRSELSWVGSARDRRVVLKRGEALFEVVPDAKRPFVVVVGATEIRVLGTVFDVYQSAHDGALLVTVVEGTVHVTQRDTEGVSTWSQVVTANQQIKHRPGASPSIRSIDATRAVEWRSGNLDIADESLPNVMAEFSRYTEVRLTLADDARLRQLHVGGVYSVNDIDRALAGLERRAPIHVIRNPEKNEYTVRYRDAMSERSAPTSVPAGQAVN